MGKNSTKPNKYTGTDHDPKKENYTEEYHIIKKQIENTWPDWKKEIHNNSFAISKHSNKINIGR